MKKVMIGIGILVVVIAVAFFFIWKNLDSIVKTAIETYGSEATQTAVRVAAVKLDLKDGQATITGLSVANPKGFVAPDIFKLGVISTKIDTSTISKNPIIIDNIHIGAPSVVYEINGAGVSNVDVLKKNLGVGTGGSKSASKSESSGTGRRMIIRRIVVDGTSAKVRIAALGGKELSVSLPTIVMTDVGKKSGGATATEVARQLSDRMLGNVKAAVAKIGVGKYLGKSADAVKAQMQKSAGSAGGMLKGLLGQ